MRVAIEFRNIHKGVKEEVIQTIIQHSMVPSHKFQEDVINICAFSWDWPIYEDKYTLLTFYGTKTYISSFYSR